MNKILIKITETARQLFDFKSGHARSIKAKKNIYASFLTKGVSIIIGFALIRLNLDYVDKELYGVWLTLTSFLTWYSFFEIGLGNGLRNKLATALAKNDIALGKTYVSTTYFILSIIVIVISSIFFIINPFLNWSTILNTSSSLSKELYIISTIVFGCFFIRFVLKLISNILFADQLPAVANAIIPLSNIFVLLQVFLLNKYTEGNLIYLGLVLSLNPVIAYLIFSIWLFSGKYKKIRPSYKSVEWKYGKDLMSLGFNFFVISISRIVILQLSSIIIAQTFSPSDVTVYNVAFKLFSLSSMIFLIITSPLWSAYTEAWVKDEKEWIIRNINQMRKIYIGLVIFNILLLIMSPFIFKIWLGGQIEVPFTLSIGLVLFFSITDYRIIFLQFNNGISKLRLQLYAVVIGAIIYVPLCLLFINYFELGLISIPIAMILSQLKNTIIAPMQYRRLITNTATGIWNK